MKRMKMSQNYKGIMLFYSYLLQGDKFDPYDFFDLQTFTLKILRILSYDITKS